MVLDVSKGKVSLREQPKRLEIGEPVPDFTMTTQDGKPLKLSDLRGNVVVLTFIYTRCPLPDFCPLMDRKFAELASRIAAIPERAQANSPDFAVVRPRARHARSAGASTRRFAGLRRPLWSFAVASHEELAKIAAPLGLFYEPGNNEIAHNLCTAIIDPAGKTGPPGSRHSPQQVGKCRPVEDHLFTDPTLRYSSGETDELRSSMRRRVLAATLISRTSLGTRACGYLTSVIRSVTARSNKCDESKR